MKGSNDEPLDDIDAHRVAKKLVRVFAVARPSYLVVRESLESCGFGCRDPSSTGSEPVALCFGEGESGCFGSWSWVFEERCREMFGDGPVSLNVFFGVSCVRLVDLFGGSL